MQEMFFSGDNNLQFAIIENIEWYEWFLEWNQPDIH